MVYRIYSSFGTSTIGADRHRETGKVAMRLATGTLLTALLITACGDLDIQVDATTDVERPYFDWQPGGSFADADGLFVSMRWLLSDTDLYWVMLTPPDSPEVATFPELPAELAFYLPPHPDDYDDPVFYQGIYAVDADWVSGYQDMRSYSLGFLTHPTLPTGKHIVRYTYGGATYLRTWLGRLSD